MVPDGITAKVLNFSGYILGVYFVHKCLNKSTLHEFFVCQCQGLRLILTLWESKTQDGKGVVCLFFIFHYRCVCVCVCVVDWQWGVRLGYLAQWLGYRQTIFTGVSIRVYHGRVNIVPGLHRRALLFIHPACNRLHRLTPSFQSILPPPHALPPGNRE